MARSASVSWLVREGNEVRWRGRVVEILMPGLISMLGQGSPVVISLEREINNVLHDELEIETGGACFAVIADHCPAKATAAMIPLIATIMSALRRVVNRLRPVVKTNSDSGGKIFIAFC